MAGNRHRATRGCLADEESAGLAGGALHFRPRGGRRRPKPHTPFRSEARRHYARDLPGPRARRPLPRVLRLRRTTQVRLFREACLVDLQACQLRTRKEAKRCVGFGLYCSSSTSLGPLLVLVGPTRCEAVQATGRRHYLVTRAAVLGVGEGVPPTATLHAHKPREKASEATLWALALPEVPRRRSPRVAQTASNPPVSGGRSP